MRRADLRSESSSSEHSSSDLGWNYREHLTRHYTAPSEPSTYDIIGSRYEENGNRDAEQAESENADEYEFQLFSKHNQPSQSSIKSKVILRSPSPSPENADFINFRRPDTYYFTGQLKREVQEQYEEAAISPQLLLQGLDSRWVR